MHATVCAAAALSTVHPMKYYITSYMDRSHTTSGMAYYPLGLTPTMYMMHCIVGVLGVEREGYIHHVVYLHQ